MKFVIEATPRTKKNGGSRRMCGKRNLSIPSEAFLAFQAVAVPLLRRQWCGRAPINHPVNARALFYRDARRGDAVGYYQALADVLEKAGVVRNDVLIETWDGSRMRKDADHPRIELVLEVLQENDR